MKNLLLIDSDLREYQVFVDSLNTDTIPFVYSSITTRTEVIDKLTQFTTIHRIGIVNEIYNLFLEGEPIYSNVNTNFILNVIHEFQIKNIDFLACNTLNNSKWKDFYNKLQNETEIIIGASDNNTGNLKYGGDWLLENTNEDIEKIYFTTNIEYYKYILGTSDTLFVIKTDGTLWGTGRNNVWQLGNGLTADSKQFINITTLQSDSFKSKTINKVVNSQYSSLVLMTDNTLWIAGDINFYVSPHENRFQLITSFSSSLIKNITSAQQNFLALLEDGTLWGIGYGDFGSFGTVISGGPTQIPDITGTITFVASSNYSTFALTSDNKLWVTGANTYGQLGLGNTNTKYEFTKIDIDTLTGKTPSSVVCSANNSAVVMTDGTIWCAGYLFTSSYVQASNVNGYSNGSRIPISISGGSSHMIAVMNDGTVWGVGAGNSGELGTLGYTNVFTQLTIPVTMKAVHCFNNSTICLGTDNTTYVTGDNLYGQLGFVTPSSSNGFVTSVTSVKSIPNYNYNIITTVTITSITQAANGLVTINGTNFVTPTVTMTGGYTSGTVTQVSANQLTFTPSSLIGSSTFTVTDSGTSVSYTASFPTIISIIQDENGVVTMNGTNFVSPTVTMTGGFTSGTVTKVSSSQLTFTPTPIMLPTPITFTLSDSGSSVTYIYTSNVNLPIIAHFTPSSGTRNTVVTISGSNFGNVTSVLFGSVTATNPTITETTIIVNAPVNNKSVPITLITSGFSVISSTNFTYNTNPTLFTSSTTEAYDKLLSQLSLTDGIADTGVLNLGSSTTPINFSGPTYGVTMASSDNSSALATTAFVKAQGYATGSPSGYAQMTVSQTWSALQTFSAGVLSSSYNALTATSNVSVGSNLTTGILNLGTSTSTVNLNVPLTPTYTAASVSGQVGYTQYLPPLDTITYLFHGGDLVYRYVPIVPGTYVATAAVSPEITLDYFMIYFAALKVTPAEGLDVTLYAIPADRILAFAGLKAIDGTNVVLAGAVWSTTSTFYIPSGYTTLALVTNTYKGPVGNSPYSKINTTMTVTRIA